MRVIPVHIASEDTMVSQSLLNANAFPEEHKKIVHYASVRLARFFYSRKRLKTDLAQCENGFYTHLKRNWESYKKSAIAQKPNQIVVNSETIEYLSSIHFALYELKSFLDIYAYLICKSLPSKEKSVSFSGKKFGNEALSGGSFINWINNTSEKKYPEKNQMVEIFYRNSSEWITGIIKLRDDIAHTKELDNITPMRVNVTESPKNIKRKHIEHPVINEGMSLEIFIGEIIRKTGMMVSDTVFLLPDIDKSKLATWDNAQKHFII